MLRGILPVWFPRVNEILRLIGSHNVFCAPTAAQMADPDLRPLIDRYLPGAKGMPSGLAILSANTARALSALSFSAPPTRCVGLM